MSGEENWGLLLGFVVALGSLPVLAVVFIVSLVKAISTRKRGWIIAAAATPVLCIAVAIVGVALAFAHKRREQGAVVEGHRQVTSTDGEISLVVPASWRDMPDLHDDAVIEVGDVLREEYLIVLRENKVDFEGSLLTYAEHVASDMQEFARSKDELKYEPVSVGGCAGLRVKFGGVVERSRIGYDLTALETADSYCQVLTWTKRSRVTEARPKFDAALASFKAEAGAPPPGEEQQDE